MQCEVAGLGTILVDQQVFLETYPERDTKTEVNGHRLQVGGPVPTALVMLARFGKSCRFVGQWGKDTFGEFIANDLRRENVQFDNEICAKADSTGFAQVWVDAETASRTIAFARGEGEVDPAEIDENTFASCRLLHLDGWSSGAAIKAAQAVKQQGGTVFLDAGSPKPGLHDLLPYVDIVNAPERFASLYFSTDDIDQAAQRLQEMGPDTVIFTRGTNGAVLHNSDGRIEQSAFPVAAVDTTGAGDVFCGAYLYGLLDQWAAGDCLRFAAATAALKCTRIGNRDALPKLDEVIELIR
jgi:sugar/nucleoside kinase (ribokinase family)